MVLPEFVGIGVQRAGTTWLFESLNEYPELCLPAEKETHFFNWYWEKGLDWYENRFQACDHSIAIGEITPSYIYSRDVIPRLRKTVPDAKLFAVLRNPVDRAYSAYWLFKERRYRGMSFEEAIHADKELLERGHYAEQLERVFGHYPEDQVLVLFYSDLKKNPKSFLKQIYGFLGVKTKFTPSTINKSYNAVMFPRIQALLRDYNLVWIKEYAKKIGIDRPIRKLHKETGKGSYPEMNERTRQELREYFHQHDIDLENNLRKEIPWIGSCD